MKMGGEERIHQKVREVSVFEGRTESGTSKTMTFETV